MRAKAKGSGISLRKEHYDDILNNKRQLDWIEFNPENFMGTGVWARSVLEKLQGRFPMFAHGVCLSIGGPDPFRKDYMDSLKELLDFLDPEYYSEHISYASAGGIEFHDLMPMPHNEESAKWIAKRAKQVEDWLERPLVLENISYYANMPTSTMSEGEWITAILEEYDGGMLLDVNNCFVNSNNFARTPSEILLDLPLHRVKHIHMAGHRRVDELLIDDHGSHACPEVWQLYRQAIEICGPVPTMFEWESNTPTWDRLLDEADTARRYQEEVTARRAAQAEKGQAQGQGASP